MLASLRLLRLAAPRRGVRAPACRGDVPRQAGDSHALLGKSRLHDRRQQLPGRLRAAARGRGQLPVSGQTANGRPRTAMHAARLMREVFDNPLEAERRGRQGGRRHPAGALAGSRRRDDGAAPEDDPHASGARPSGASRQQSRANADRIDTVAGAHRPPPSASDTTAAGRPVRRLARRAALRVMRPVTEYQRQLSDHQRQVDEALVGELGRLRRRGGAQVASLLAELRSQEAALRSILAEVAALRAESVRGQGRASSDPVTSPAGPGGGAADETPAIVSAAGARHADHIRNPPPTR